MNRIVSLVFIALVMVATDAWAQVLPMLQGASNDIVVVGKTQELTLRGENIGDATRVIVVGEGGVEVELPKPATRPATQATQPATKPATQPATQPVNPKELKVRVSVKPDAPRGPRELRVVTPNGVSMPLVISVEDYAAIADKEPNNSFSEAQTVTLPAILVGAIEGPTQADFYRFEAKKGQRLIFDVIAARTGSPLDANLVLLDGAGREVARNADTNGLDPLIDYTPPADGSFTLKIRDLRYQGGGNFSYRIRAGEIPYVDSIFPLGGKRGEQVTVELVGRNLDSPKLDMMLDPSMPMGRREVTAATARGATNAKAFDVSDLPESMESEPNDSPTPNPVNVPQVINGRIGQAGDTDKFILRVPTTQPVVADVFAGRYGSQLDALLTLSDKAGSVLARNDDAAGADARIQFSAEPNKDYVVAVTDLLGRGGANYAYRLQLAAPPKQEPDFDVVFTPESPRVARGSATKVWCQVRRRAGFEGDVVVALLDAPQGVTCDPLLFRNGMGNSGLMLLKAAADAPLGMTPLNLVATGRYKDKALMRELAPSGASKESPRVYLTVLDKPPFLVERVGDPAGADPQRTAEQIAALKKILDTNTPELESAQAKWEAGLLAKQQWHPVEVVTLLSRYGAKVRKLPDGAILSEGKTPPQEVYNLTLRTKLKKVTALKLEAIADDNKGPGRADDGNFVLSAIELVAAPTADESKRASIDLARPQADFVQAGFDINQTLNLREPGHQSGWAVHPQTAQSHWATWALQHPLTNDGGTTLSVTLDHHYGGPKFILRKFRIMVSDQEKPQGGFSLAENLLVALNTPREQRSDAQKAKLAAHYRSIAPELKETREKLVSLQARSAPYPPVLVGNTETSVLVKVQRNGYEGDINLTLEGFTSGFDSKPGQPSNEPPISKNLDVKPVTLKGNASEAVLMLKSSGKTDRATRTVVVKAEAAVNGAPYVQYSELFPVTVKDAPKAPEKAEKGK